MQHNLHWWMFPPSGWTQTLQLHASKQKKGSAEHLSVFVVNAEGDGGGMQEQPRLLLIHLLPQSLHTTLTLWCFLNAQNQWYRMLEPGLQVNESAKLKWWIVEQKVNDLQQQFFLDWLTIFFYFLSVVKSTMFQVSWQFCFAFSKVFLISREECPPTLSRKLWVRVWIQLA